MKVIVLGAGGRGRVYTNYCRQYGAEIIAVADPDVKKLHKLGKDFDISEDRLYTDWREAMGKTDQADALINATPDRIHYETTMLALERGLHVLLEKPMSPSEEECVTMVETAEKKGLILMVCHVLRYAPFFETLKEVIDSGRIGKLINIDLTENVVYWHFAHSFVRGVFRNEEQSSPFILQKSCHDLDLIGYLTGKKCLSVVSEGGLTHFTEENKPEGAPKYCLDGCPHEKTCPHFAPALYLKQFTDVTWPTNSISVDDSYIGRYKALQSGLHGRCVYQCDNTVADHQSAIFSMEGGMTVDFNMIGFASENTRTLRVYGTLGDIRGHLEKGELEITEFLNMKKEVIRADNKTIISGHGGGDSRLLKDFIDAVNGDAADIRTTARLSLQSHLMAFAAEKSRKEGVSIMGKFCTSCGTALNEGAKFCAKCGANALQSNESAQISTETPPQAAKSEQEIPKTMNNTKKKPLINQASENAPQHSSMGTGKFIITYIRQSLTVLKNPKQMLPTALLGLVWLVLALLGSFGINPLLVRILSFLTFAQGGMFGGVFGAVGGILGKVAVAAFLNAAIVPLFQKKAPFSGIGGGIKGFFGGLAVKSITAVAPLLGGVGVSLLLYAFMNSTQSLQNSMVGIIAFVMLLQNLGRQGGFLWGLAFSAANSLSKGRTPSYIVVTRCISGMTLGFALGVALSAVRLRWCGWLGVLLLIAALIFVIVSKGKKEVAAA